MQLLSTRPFGPVREVMSVFRGRIARGEDMHNHNPLRLGQNRWIGRNVGEVSPVLSRELRGNGYPVRISPSALPCILFL
jgi:hypothetical protein